MTAADGVEEAARAGQPMPGRHAAWGSVGGRPGSVPASGPAAGRRPAAWVVVPAVCSAVLAGAAVVLVVNGAKSAGYHISGGTMTAVWVLGFLILAVTVGTLALAGRSTGPAVDARFFVEPEQPYPAQQMPQASPPAAPTAPPPEVAARAAEAAAVMAAVNSPDVSTAVVSEEGVDLQVIFAQLVRRLLTLVLQQINRLDELENEVEDPKLLKALFGIDHQATQVRRYGENIGVLVGAMPQRQWTQPVPVTVAQRSAVSETPDYPRVQVIPRAPGRIHGHAVSDVIHILSELVENATNYSNPSTKVTVGAHRVAAGLAIEINDHGIGMEQDQFQRLNTLLRDPSGTNVRDLLSQGRIGLSVVAKMAQRHGIAVELRPNVTGGTMALVVIPDALLAPEERPADERRQQRRSIDTTQLAAKPALAPLAGDRLAPVAAAAPGSAAALSPVAAPARPKPQPQPQPQTPAPRYATQPGPAEVPPPLPRHVEPEPEPSLLPDGRPQLRRRTPQGHISARLLQAEAPESPHGTGALTPTVMADFWLGLSGQEPTAPAPVNTHLARAYSPPPSTPAYSDPRPTPPPAPNTSSTPNTWTVPSGPAQPPPPAPVQPKFPDLRPSSPDPGQHDRTTVNRQEWNQ